MTQPSEQPESSANEIRYVNLYEPSSKIYTRKVQGFYQRLRRYAGIPLMLGFLLMPWLVIDNRPAMLFDLSNHKFHILFVTFWPQDFILLAWLLIIAAFMLFTVTVTVGRVWCGFTCPQTVWTLIYIWIENFCEGDRNKRIKLDKQPWNPEKVARKTAKHGLWLLIAFVTGATFVGYFLPIRELLSGFFPSFNEGQIVWHTPAAAIFWTFLFTLFTYVNAGWLREQVCKHMCPYARFQGVMYDHDTLYVQYDKARGETRGARKPTEDPKAKGLGDCVDCSWCVQVCPVDIDIRDGTQFECINCGLCVDACNSIMDKMNYPRGLIRFTSEDELATGRTNFFRPRLFGYLIIVLVMLGVLVYTIYNRSPLGVDVLRDRSARMYRVQGKDIENVYKININNMDRATHTYTIELDGDLPYTLKNYRPMPIIEGEVFSLPIRVSVPKTAIQHESTDLIIRIIADDNPAITATEKTVFMAPQQR
ncbi:MAG: cytochrome c oxidase accessory protein CcoG [Marinagarivorans sp.]|nr:cytochrome c oxidase accessory protein CcoG [Marinagarivorans sp.]